MSALNSRKRRSQRFPHKVPVVLSSREPQFDFYESCETSDVSSHGCQVRTQRKLRPGLRVQLKLFDPERCTQAQVMRVHPDLSGMAWEVGVALAEPGNIWGLEFSGPMVHWPADLPPPPLRGALAAAAVPNSPQSKEEVNRPPDGESFQPPGAEPGSQPDPAPGGTSLTPREVETHWHELVREMTNRLTQNTQFALHTLEEGIQEMSDSARNELKEWWTEQRAELDREFRQRADTSRKLLLQETLEELGRQNQQRLAQELERVRVELQDALEAGLRTFVARLSKAKAE